MKPTRLFPIQLSVITPMVPVCVCFLTQEVHEFEPIYLRRMFSIHALEAQSH